MLKKTTAVLIVLLLLTCATSASAASDYGRYEGSWELPLPLNLRTDADYQRYEKAREGVTAVTVLCFVGTVIAAKQAHALEREAGRMTVTSSTLVQDPINKWWYYPIDPGLSAGQKRLRHKADMYRQISIAFGMFTIAGASLTYSLRF